MSLTPGTINIYKLDDLDKQHTYRIQFVYGKSTPYCGHREQFIQQYEVNDVDYWKDIVNVVYQNQDLGNGYYVIKNYEMFRRLFEKNRPFKFQFNMAFVIGVLAVLTLLTYCASVIETNFFNTPQRTEQDD